MPYSKHKTVFRRMRQNIRRRERNRIVKGSLRALLRATRIHDKLDDVFTELAWQAPSGERAEILKKTTAKMYSIIDKACKKGVIHRNKAARHKAQIMRWLNKIAE